MKEVIRKDLKDRYTSETLDILNKATFLDPRFKGLNFLEQAPKDEILRIIAEECGLTTEVNREEESPLKKSCGEHKLLELLEEVVQPTMVSHQELTIEDKVQREIRKYIAEDKTSENPLTWWKVNGFRYPILSELVKKYLCILATSVPSERAFSKAGHIVNDKRACLLPDSVNMLVFFV